MSVVTATNPRVELTLGQLKAIQSLASGHITFSLTLNCPLRCAHCIVDGSPDQRSTTMPLEAASDYAAQMPDLAAYGIRSVSFTGGEPFVAPKQLEVLADAASAAGMSCGVVTAGHWARTAAHARKTVERFRAIGAWDLSTDSYHLPFVPLDALKNAYDALIALNRLVTIRFTHTEPASDEDKEILAFVATLDQAQFAYQRVRPVGRAKSLGIATSHQYNPWVKPCLTQGMVVRYDGSIAPCCLNLVEARRHPFQFGQATARSLVEIHREYMAMPLLQLIRALGFHEIMGWLEEEGLTSRLPRLPDEVCGICTLIMRDDEIARFLVAKTSEPDVQLKIAVVASRVLGENAMLRTVLDRFPDLAGAREARQLLAHEEDVVVAEGAHA